MSGLASVGTFMSGQGAMSGWEWDRSKKIGTVPPESGQLVAMLHPTYLANSLQNTCPCHTIPHIEQWWFVVLFVMLFAVFAVQELISCNSNHS